MDELSEKVIRDPVHGNIRVPSWVCAEIIDTDVFQRLRYVEQSSIGLLYPGARHNRFVHSVGVFHIATKVFGALRRQFEKGRFNKADIEEFEQTFLAAALLHDCAHSPFSHTGEVLAETYCKPEIETLLIKCVKSKRFTADFYNTADDSEFHAHEMASAYVGGEVFRNVFKKHKINREQFARMIIGLKNDASSADRKTTAYNCLIRLLNGFIVDADRLDYLLRDTWASGVCNTSVDLDRLIDGLRLDLKKGVVKIHFKVLSSMVNAVSARDYIYTWILPHHKVGYANTLLNLAIKALVREMARRSKSAERKKDRLNEAEVGRRLFSPERLLRSKSADICQERISLPTDGDLIYLMKKYIPDNQYVLAYLSRRREYVSLWKTYAEFAHLFGVEKYKEDVLCDQRFWKMYESHVVEYCQKHPELITTGIQSMKQTADEMLTLDIVSGRKGENEFDPSSMFKKDGRRRYYFYVFNRWDSRRNSGKVIAELQRLFAQCVDEFRHR